MLQRGAKLGDRQAGGTDETAQSSFGKGGMIGHGEGGYFSGFGHDDVSASLPRYTPAETLEVTHRFSPAQSGQLRHYGATSTCRVSTVNGIPDSARTSMQSSIASFTFARASSSVSPWLTHPGMEGHSATQTPSSSRSIVTTIFVAQSLRLPCIVLSKYPLASPSTIQHAAERVMQSAPLNVKYPLPPH